MLILDVESGTCKHFDVKVGKRANGKIILGGNNMYIDIYRR